MKHAVVCAAAVVAGRGRAKSRLFMKLAGLFFLLFSAGCARYADLPVGTSKPIVCGPVSPVVEQETITLAQPADVQPPIDYIIGVGDLIYVQLYGRPDLTTLATPGGMNSGGLAAAAARNSMPGSRVDGSGAIRVPLLGSVKVTGLTIEQARLSLEQAYAKYFRQPSVMVEIAEYKSQPLYLLGQFKVAGVYYLDRPLTLLQGIALGGGFDPTANISSARLIRDNKTVPVDVYALLMQGGMAQNVWLRPGDSIFVPDNRSQFVFVFGAVSKPGPVPYPPAGLNLAQAIASAELRDTGYNERQVRIIRSHSPTKGELIVVDFAKVLRGEAFPFMLKEGDIVYIPKSALGNWNDAVNEMLPSLQAIGALLNPFVQVKFLSGH